MRDGDATSWRWLSVGIVLLASAVPYAGTLSYDFVWDDLMQVQQNPWITDVRYLRDIFTHSVWGFHGGGHTSAPYYRPMMNVLLLFTFYVFGPKPWGFHLLNVLMHVATSAVVFFIAARLVPDTASPMTRRILPLVAGLLFALHPIHTEAVAWVCGMTDVSCALFFLLSIYCYIGARATGGTTGVSLSLLFFAVALLCKEGGLSLPLVLLAYELGRRHRGQSLVPIGRRLMPFAAVAAAYLLVRVRVLGGFAPVAGAAHPSLRSVALNAFELFARYLAALCLPSGLNALHTTQAVGSVSPAHALVAVAIAVVSLAAGIAAYRSRSETFFALALVAFPLLPALPVALLGQAAFAERYLYLPSAGFVVLVASGFVRLWEQRRVYRSAVVAALFALAGFYSVQTVARNPVWQNNVSLYGDMVRQSPASEDARDNLANALMADGRTDEAIGLYRSIVQTINPNSAKGYYNLALALEKKEQPEEAAAAYEKSLSLNANSMFAHRAHANVGYIYLRSGQPEKALDHFRLAVSRQPQNAAYHNMLGMVHGTMGAYKQAIAEFEKAIALAPEERAWRINLAKARQLQAARLSGGAGPQ